MTKKEKHIALRSEEVQEILGHVPNWMIRWGNTFILGMIIGLLSISWFVKYPDTIGTQILVTTNIPPEKIYANSQGQLDALLVTDNQKIDSGKILAIVENSSNFEDVIMLKNTIDTLKVNYENFYFPLEKLPILFLGDIAPDYALFEKSYSDYFLNKELKPLSNESMANRLSLAEARSQLSILSSQKVLSEKELIIKKKDLDRFETLYGKGAVSTQEYDQKQLEYLQAQRALKSINASISQLRNLINNSNKNLRGTEIKKRQQDNSYLTNVIQSFNQLKRSIRNWELKYVLKSSVKGKISFLSFWDKNQTVNPGDLVFTVIPTDYTSFVGKIKAPAHNSGKIKVGQLVNIRLANYPYTEFGQLEGTVKSISLVPDKEGNYLIDINLPKKLVTSYNKEIEFKQEMTGTAQIITEDLRLIERFFYQLKTVFSR